MCFLLEIRKREVYFLSNCSVQIFVDNSRGVVVRKTNTRRIAGEEGFRVKKENKGFNKGFPAKGEKQRFRQSLSHHKDSDKEQCLDQLQRLAQKLAPFQPLLSDVDQILIKVGSSDQLPQHLFTTSYCQVSECWFDSSPLGDSFVKLSNCKV